SSVATTTSGQSASSAVDANMHWVSVSRSRQGRQLSATNMIRSRTLGRGAITRVSEPLTARNVGAARPTSAAVTRAVKRAAFLRSRITLEMPPKSNRARHAPQTSAILDDLFCASRRRRSIVLPASAELVLLQQYLSQRIASRCEVNPGWPERLGEARHGVDAREPRLQRDPQHLDP